MKGKNITNQISNEIFNVAYFQYFEPKQEGRQNNNVVKREETSEVVTPDMVKYPPILIFEQPMSLYEFIMTRHPPSWTEFFKGAQTDIQHACQKVEESCNASGKSFLPQIPRVLAAFWATPLFMLKAVIIGQDPYPGFTKTGMPKAIGLCFASERGYEMPDSLITVYEELQRSVEGWTHPGHPDLRCWAREGVLMLNS